MPKYDHYDPIIKAIAIQSTFNTSQAQAARFTSFWSDDIKLLLNTSWTPNIPRQSVFILVFFYLFFLFSIFHSFALLLFFVSDFHIYY